MMDENKYRYLDYLLPELNAMLIIFNNEDGTIVYLSPNTQDWISQNLINQKVEKLSDLLDNSFEKKRKSGTFDFNVKYSYPVIKSREVQYVGIKFIKIEDEPNSIAIIYPDERNNEQSNLDDFLYLFPEAYFETDNEGFITNMNKTGCEKLEIQDLKQKKQIHISEIICSEDKSRLLNNFKRNLEGERYLGSTYRIISSSGKKFFVEIFSAGIINNDGKRVGIRGIAIDITNRIAIEKKLLENEERYRTIFDNSPLGIYRTTPEGRFIEANNSLAQTFGFKSAKEMFEKVHDVKEQLYADPAVRENMIKEVREHNEIIHKETFFRRKDQTEFNGKIHMKAIKDKNGKTLYLDGLLEDITERKKNEEKILLNDKLLKVQNRKLKKAKEKAEESDRLKSAFLSNMSHEIRTPLNGIMGFSNLLIEEELELDKRIQFTQIVNDSCYQLFNIVNDILDISKIETSQISINKTEVNIDNLLNELYNFFKPNVKLEKLDFRLESDSDKKPLIIFSDITRIKQITTNLLANALKFTENGEVVFGYKLKKNKLIIYVQDTGIGIKQEDQLHIFERFRQVGETTYHRHGGTGLGLAISKGLAELLGGKVKFESEYGKGSTFYLHLPLK